MEAVNPTQALPCWSVAMEESTTLFRGGATEPSRKDRKDRRLKNDAYRVYLAILRTNAGIPFFRISQGIEEDRDGPGNTGVPGIGRDGNAKASSRTAPPSAAGFERSHGLLLAKPHSARLIPSGRSEAQDFAGNCSIANQAEPPQGRKIAVVNPGRAPSAAMEIDFCAKPQNPGPQKEAHRAAAAWNQARQVSAAMLRMISNRLVRLLVGFHVALVII